MQDLRSGTIALRPSGTFPFGNPVSSSSVEFLTPSHFSRAQAERLIRDIDQNFEIRANSELEQPKPEAARRVFISHGRSNDWRAVQALVEKDVGLHTPCSL